MKEKHHSLAPQPGKQALVIVDVQDAFTKAMNPEVFKQVINNIGLLAALSEKLSLPVVSTEQYPKGLGRTVKEIQESLKIYQPIEKLCFNCWENERFQSRLKNLTRVEEIILSGIETHVCILQTALGLVANGYKVYIPADATCSRRKLDWEIGLKLMDTGGAIVTTTETLIFQLLKKAGTEEFRFMSKLLK